MPRRKAAGGVLDTAAKQHVKRRSPQEMRTLTLFQNTGT